MLAISLVIGSWTAQAGQADEPPGTGANQKFRAFNMGQEQNADSNHNDSDQPYAIVWESNDTSAAQVFETIPKGDAFQLKVDTGECLQAEGNAENSKLAKKPCNKQNPLQLWQFEKDGDIVFVHPDWSEGLVVTAPSESKPLELRIKSSNDKNQQWLISNA